MEPVLAAWLSWGGGFKGNLVAEAMSASIQCYAAGGSANNGEFGLDSRRPRMYEPCRSLYCRYLPYTKSRKNERAERRGGERGRGEEEKRGRERKAHGTGTDGTGETTANGQKKPKSPNPPSTSTCALSGVWTRKLWFPMRRGVVLGAWPRCRRMLMSHVDVAMERRIKQGGEANRSIEG